MKKIVIGMILGVMIKLFPNACPPDPYSADIERLYARLIYDYAEVIDAYGQIQKIYEQEQTLLMQRPYTSGSSNILMMPGSRTLELEHAFAEQINKLKLMAKIKLAKTIENCLEKRRFPRIELWATIGWYFYYEPAPCTVSGFKERVRDAITQLDSIHQILMWRQRDFPLVDTITLDCAQISLSLNKRVRALSDKLTEIVNVLDSLKTISLEEISKMSGLLSNPNPSFFQ
ncbi:MAG TPA: hypothetical protein VHA52_03750 [Candidatus Babeliaceae bacterium]|nr:hypothetical protein [Candidatus Babeliaceae bacterium]